MKIEQALTSIQRLQRQTSTLVALTPEDHRGCGLPVVRKLVNAETNEPIFVYVNRIDLIEVLRVAHNLHKKGTSIATHRN